MTVLLHSLFIVFNATFSLFVCYICALLQYVRLLYAIYIYICRIDIVHNLTVNNKVQNIKEDITQYSRLITTKAYIYIFRTAYISHNFVLIGLIYLLYLVQL